MTHAEPNSAERLAAIISAGVAAYEATLPTYAQRSSAEAGAPSVAINFTLGEERQISICLNCPLTDCVGIESKQCPIRVEQRRAWREQRQGRVSQ